MTTLEPQPEMPADPGHLGTLRQRLVARLHAFRARVRTYLAVEGAARVLGAAVGLAALSLVLDRWLRLGQTVRVVLLLMALGAIGYAAWRFLVMPLRTRMGYIDLAAKVEHRMRVGPAAPASAEPVATAGPTLPIAARVASVLQLPELLNGPFAPSPAMVDAAVRRSDADLQTVDFNDHLDRHRLKLSLAAIAALILLPAVFATVFPEIAGLWARRWLLASTVEWPQDTYLVLPGVEGDRIVVPRGEPYTLRVAARDKSELPGVVTLKSREAKAPWITASMTRFGDTEFRHDFPPIQERTEVWLEGGDDELGPITIEPVDRPRITNLELIARHPSQKEPSRHTFTGADADPAYLVKTELELTLETNVPIAEAHLRGAAPPAGELRRLADNKFAVAWTHEKPVSTQIELVSRDAGLSSLPLPVSIGLKADQVPRVTLQYSGVRQRVAPGATIPLTIQARDDRGLSRVGLHIKADLYDPEKKVEPPPPQDLTLEGPLSPAIDTELSIKHTLELAPMKLVPGAILNVTSTASDEAFTGAQVGQSRTVGFRVVSPEELFREILLRQQAERAKFRKATEEAEAIRDALGRTPDSEALTQLARRHRAVQREAQRIGNVLGDSLTETKLNALGSPELHELMQNNILGPLKVLTEDTMARQRDALDQLALDASESAVSDALARQAQIVESMRGILKQMAQWDSFVDVLTQLNEIIKLELKLRETTEKVRDAALERVFQPATQPATQPAR
jgi:hypothetical protein